MNFNSQICTTEEQSKRLLALGLKRETADCVMMYYDGWHIGEAEHFDFLGIENCKQWDGDIITNPPYKYALEFVYKALSLIPTGRKVAMFLKLQFLEGKARKELFRQFPPKVVYVFSSRILCAKNAEFEQMLRGGSAVAYAWYVWEKGYKGDTIVKWIN